MTINLKDLVPLFNEISYASACKDALHLIQERSQEAQKYCEKYNLGQWGDSVWHAVLDDAIRMRKELEKK